jgi:hypothetical protein
VNSGTETPRETVQFGKNWLSADGKVNAVAGWGTAKRW